MSFSCPNIPLINDPKGLYIPIQDIQNRLGLLNWVEYSFGRAFTRKEPREETTYIAPKVYAGNKEYLIVEPRDDVSAFTFIELNGDETINDWETQGINRGYNSTQNISVVMFANLRKIDTDRDYIFDEELKLDLLKQIKDSPYVVTINSIERGLSNVWSPYSYDTIEDVFYSDNFATYRINCDIRLYQRCFEDQTFNLQTCKI